MGASQIVTGKFAAKDKCVLQLLQRYDNKSFLNRIATSDEKWVLHNNTR